MIRSAFKPKVKSIMVGDLTFGLNEQAYAVLKELSKIKIESLSDAFYNGREKGFCLTITNYNDLKSTFCILCYEHRSSDTIIVSSFERPYSINPVTLDECIDHKEYKVWDQKLEFKAGTFKKVADSIIGLITVYLTHQE